jgi:hypothetical protein
MSPDTPSADEGLAARPARRRIGERKNLDLPTTKRCESNFLEKPR